MIRKLLFSDKSWAVKKRAFRIWQKTPHQVAPISDELRTCQSCGTEFKGNFCPRCGQAAVVGRFSFKTAFLLFLDIWGIGNRGMFRSIRDLMLRPGFMIRDYVSGLQSSYFPPFKMFFILSTFSLLLTHGFNLTLDEPKETNVEKEVAESITVDGNQVNERMVHSLALIPKYISAMEKKSPALFFFGILMLLAAPLYLFFRRCPAIPDLRYSEHIVAMVYTSNMNTLYCMLADLIPIGFLSALIKILAVIMIFIALKQFTGYSKRRLVAYVILAFILFFIFFVVAITIVTAMVYYFYNR